MSRFLRRLCHGTGLLALTLVLGCSHWQRTEDREDEAALMRSDRLEPISTATERMTREPPLAPESSGVTTAAF